MEFIIQNQHFPEEYHHFSASEKPIFKTCEDEKVFSLDNENIKQEIGIQLSFILQIKLQKKHILAIYC